jgi:hypothetical protein
VNRRRPAPAARASCPGRRVRLVGAAAALLIGVTASFLVSGTVDENGGPGGEIPRSEAVPVAQAAPEDRPTPGGGAETGADARVEPEPSAPAVEVRRASPPARPAATPPTRIMVDGLLDVPVVPVGVDRDGSMELPSAGDVAGWYRFGPAPGDRRGSVVVASHVDTSEGVGEFASLPDAGRGDRVTVVGKDGTEHDYRVEKVQRFDKTAVPLDSLFDRDGEPRLVLVTCGGRWLPDVGSYEDNLVVTAVPDAPAGAAR